MEITIKNASEISGIGERSILRLVHSGVLKSNQCPNTRRHNITVSSFVEWMNSIGKKIEIEEISPEKTIDDEKLVPDDQEDNTQESTGEPDSLFVVSNFLKGWEDKFSRLATKDCVFCTQTELLEAKDHIIKVQEDIIKMLKNQIANLERDI